METLNNTQTTYQWNSLKLETGFWATALCANKFNQLYCADWNGTTGNLRSFSPGSNKWNNLGGAFKSEINKICADQLGNIYVVGDYNVNPSTNAKEYIVRIFNQQSGIWSILSDNNGHNYTYAHAITNIVCDANNNIYFTGNFFVENAVAIVVYYKLTNQLTTLEGCTIGGFVSNMLIDQSGRIYASWLDNASNFYISRWYGGSNWDNISYGSANNYSSFTADNKGNVYLSTDSSIYSSVYPSLTVNDMDANLPDLSGTCNCFLNHSDGLLYAAGYSFIPDSAMAQCYVKVCNSVWHDITPNDFVRPNSIVIQDIMTYVGKSKNILVSASNSTVYDGKDIKI
jgi:hypothetical protein